LTIVLAYGIYDRPYQIRASICRMEQIRASVVLRLNAKKSVSPIKLRYTIVAIMRTLSNILLNWFMGPTKNIVLGGVRTILKRTRKTCIMQ
jgi:hypothetical protein